MQMNKNTLIIASEFPPEPGGIGNHAYNLARSFHGNNFDVQVITDQRVLDDSVEQQFDKQNSFKVFRVKLKQVRAIMYFDRLYLILKHILQNDIIIASGKFSLWSVGYISIFFRNKTFVAVVHGSEVNLKNKFLKKLTNSSLNNFNHIIAVSNFTKSLIENLVNPSIDVVPNGFEIEKLIEVGIKKSNKEYPKLITVGNVTKRKGQLNVIKALPLLIKKFPNICYQIVGTPTEKEFFLSVAKVLQVEKHIVFYGIVSEKKKQLLLKSSDIFVMLSENLQNGDVEGFGIALLEANSLGIPSIGAEKCGIEDAIKNNYSGILVDNKNAKELETAIDQIVNDYASYSKNAVVWSKNFTWDKIINQYIKIINR